MLFPLAGPPRATAVLFCASSSRLPLIMRPGLILPASLVGTILVFISSRAHAFVARGQQPLVRASHRLHGPGRAVTSVSKSPRQPALMVSNQDGVLVDEFGIPIYDENGGINEDQLDDYQRNPEGLQVGDKITVIGKGLRFYHVRKFQEEGFDPEGFVGEITNLYIMSKKYEGEFSTAHRPVVCSFKQPYKFRAHMEFGEVRKSTPEEMAKNEQDLADQKALDDAERAKRDEARAAEEAAAKKAD